MSLDCVPESGLLTTEVEHVSTLPGHGALLDIGLLVVCLFVVLLVPNRDTEKHATFLFFLLASVWKQDWQGKGCVGVERKGEGRGRMVFFIFTLNPGWGWGWDRDARQTEQAREVESGHTRMARNQHCRQGSPDPMPMQRMWRCYCLCDSCDL